MTKYLAIASASSFIGERDDNNIVRGYLHYDFEANNEMEARKHAGEWISYHNGEVDTWNVALDKLVEITSSTFKKAVKVREIGGELEITIRSESDLSMLYNRLVNQALF